MKRGFTLAEILITLAIIGVVAAMTIPTLIQKYQEKVTVTKVKKFYSNFSNVIKLAVWENGNISTWDLGSGNAYSISSFSSENAEKFAEYIKPYLRIIQDCGTNSENACLSSGSSWTHLNGSSITVDYGSDERYYRIRLNDGVLVWFKANPTGCKVTDAGLSNVCAVFWIDINADKEPNVIGRDTFLIYVLSDKAAFSSNDECNTKGLGRDCLGYILQNGNMDYLKKN